MKDIPKQPHPRAKQSPAATEQLAFAPWLRASPSRSSFARATPIGVVGGYGKGGGAVGSGRQASNGVKAAGGASFSRKW